MAERRLRTGWILRERWRRATWTATALGAAAGLVVCFLVARSYLATGHAPGAGFLAVLGAILALATLLPRQIVAALGRRARRRHRLDWG
jgi:hypothetical protein